MTGKPVAHIIMKALEDGWPRVLHSSELASITGISQESIGSSLNNRLASGAGDVKRVKRGYWQFVKPESRPEPEAKVAQELPRTARGSVKVVMDPDTPEMLEVLGHGAGGRLICRDPDTRKMYQAIGL